MASTLCCSSYSKAAVVPVAAPSARVLPVTVSSSSSSVSFSLDSAALTGLRASSGGGRRRQCLERSFKRLSIRGIADAEAADLTAARPVSPSPPAPAPSKKSRVSVKPTRKERVVLRFLWLEKNIGISLDQVVPGHGIIPLCPYFFWPRKDAWEELKAKLDSKKWISRKRTIILLNQATDIINLWQQNATNSL